MTPGLDRELLAERTATVLGHLDRVDAHLPSNPDDLRPLRSETDTVILHLWQAVQVTLDLATSACVRLGLGAPGTYAEAFRQLADGGIIDRDLADRLARAAGVRNLIVHGYGRLDLRRVHAAAADGPADLRAFLAALRDAPPR